MRTTTRHALAIAGAAVLAAPALAQSVETTLRVEGASSTLVPQSPRDVAGSGTTQVVDDVDGDSVSVPSRSATAQLAGGTAALGLPLGFDLFDFGSGPTAFVNRIGPDAAPADFSSFWLFKVNHVASPVGSDEALLEAGDEVLWFFGPASIDSELDVSGPSAPVEAGQPFDVAVRSFDADGVASPAAGATVTYAGGSATTSPAGTATLTATGSGTEGIVVTARDAVRDSTAVCGFPASDPTVCGLAPAPTGAPTGGPSPAPDPVCRDVATLAQSGGSGASLRPTDANYRRIQWYARVTMQRVAAMNAWLDEGVDGGDICGGTIGQTAFVEGVTLASGGPGDLAAPPTPRPVDLDPPSAPRGGSTAPARAPLGVATRTISIEALKRVNALRARIEGGLNGGDLRPGAIGARELAPGARVLAASPGAAGAAASGAPDTSPTAVRMFRPSSTSAAKDLRVARAGLIRSSQLFRSLRSGLGPDAFAPGSIGTDSLAPGVRP